MPSIWCNAHLPNSVSSSSIHTWNRAGSSTFILGLLGSCHDPSRGTWWQFRRSYFSLFKAHWPKWVPALNFQKSKLAWQHQAEPGSTSKFGNLDPQQYLNKHIYVYIYMLHIEWSISSYLSCTIRFWIPTPTKSLCRHVGGTTGQHILFEPEDYCSWRTGHQTIWSICQTQCICRIKCSRIGKYEGFSIPCSWDILRLKHTKKTWKKHENNT